MATSPDKDLLIAALAGYQLKLTEIEARMAELRKQIAGAPGGVSAKAAAPAKKRRLSPEGRARIIAATKKRWAAVRAAKAAAAKKK
ncbi:MAG TPA: hypothetical protein VMU19_15665 [Bryobacteraceae bacterium]|nr:hypothetical protein [Bryobacteraceae bacterium]